jgi:hypothetical protein
MGGAQDKVDFHYEFVITIEAHAVGANIDNANFYGFRCFAAKDYIQSMKNSHGSGLYDVLCYTAEFDEICRI